MNSLFPGGLVEGAVVSLSAFPEITGTTDAEGFYELRIPVGTPVTVLVTGDGYTVQAHTIPDRSLTQTTVDGGVVWVNVPPGTYTVHAALLTSSTNGAAPGCGSASSTRARAAGPPPASRFRTCWTTRWPTSR
jgi:hypothetical protein